MSELRLRCLRYEDEQVARAAHAELAEEEFPFLLFFAPELEWTSYVDQSNSHDATYEGLEERRVPSSFLVAEVDGQIVGRASVRFALNDWLAREGGHIGYAVRPAYRRRGYATAILLRALEIAHVHGVDSVLMTCGEKNRGSARVIEKAGGVFEGRIVSEEGEWVRRYWIRSNLRRSR